MEDVAGLLLAAGQSTRMGEPKALLPWHGIPLLEHQLSTLALADISPVMVVLGHQFERLESLVRGRAGVQCVHNPDFRHGKTTSIKAGLHALQGALDSSTPPSSDVASVLVLSVDQPRSTDTIRRIIEEHHRPPEAGPLDSSHRITVPTYDGKGGHPLVLSMSLMGELLEISEETQGLKAVVRRHLNETRRVGVDTPEILLDLNTPEDYRDAMEM